MALSKLVIGLIAGLASVGAIGGITAAVVTSNNINTANTVEEEKTQNSEDKKPSITDSRNKTETRIDESTHTSKENNEKSEVTSGSEQMDERNNEDNSLSSRLEENQTRHEMTATSDQDEGSKKVQEGHSQEESEVEKNADGMVTPSVPDTVPSPEKVQEQDPNAAGASVIQKEPGREEGAESIVEEEDDRMQHELEVGKRTNSVVEALNSQ